MNKTKSGFLKKVGESLLESSIEKIIMFFAVTFGISVFGVAKVAESFLKHKIVLTVGQVVAILTALVIISVFTVLIRKKQKAKQKFREGTRVILSTQTYPVMSAGKYNYLNNKVQCSWTHDKEFKQQWISQNQLIEYIHTPYKASNFEK